VKAMAAHRPIDRLPAPPRCPHCGSRFTSLSRRAEGYFCHSCWRPFQDAPEVSYDFVADGWTRELAALQAAGEVVAVALAYGFLGVHVISTAPLRLRRQVPHRREVVNG